MSNWIQLASGNGYDFDEARIFGEFSMERDLAQPLAGANRYVRHTDRPWNVAIHSVCVARVILAITQDKEAAAAGLMHDCHEAVIGDIPTPVAWHIGYEAVKRLKHEVHSAIFCRLGVPHKLTPDGSYKDLINTADQAALHVERQLMMAPEPREWSVPRPGQTWMMEMYKQVHSYMEGAGGAGTNLWEWESHLAFVSAYEELVKPLLVRGAFH